MAKKKENEIVLIEQIESVIYEIRGERVMLDSDLAKLYGVPTHRLNEQVRRNIDRFPEDFLFALSDQESKRLRSQNAISKGGRGGRRHAINAFTEHGAIMAANLLNTPVAIDMSVHVVRAFVRTRRFIEQHKDLVQELKDLKRQLKAKFSEYDDQFRIVFSAIDQLIAPLEHKKRRKIGFRSD